MATSFTFPPDDDWKSAAPNVVPLPVDFQLLLQIIALLTEIRDESRAAREADRVANAARGQNR